MALAAIEVIVLIAIVLAARAIQRVRKAGFKEWKANGLRAAVALRAIDGRLRNPICVGSVRANGLRVRRLRATR